MLRSLTSLALLLAQAAAWAGGPVFVCVDRQGAVCLDGGPQFCDCCGRGGGEATVACTRVASAGHDHGHDHGTLIAAPSVAWKSGACDCTHQLAANERVATVSRASGWVVEQHLAVTAWTFAATGASLAGFGHARFIAATPLGDSLPLNLLSSVAMRC